MDCNTSQSHFQALHRSSSVSRFHSQKALVLLIYSFCWMMVCKQLLRTYELDTDSNLALELKHLKTQTFSSSNWPETCQNLSTPTAWGDRAGRGPVQWSALQSLMAHLSLSWCCTRRGQDCIWAERLSFRSVYFCHHIKKATFRKSNTTWEQHSVVLRGADSVCKLTVLSTWITAIIPYLRDWH